MEPGKLTLMHQVFGVVLITGSQALLNHFGIRVTTLLLTAYMPETGERMLGALSVEGRGIQAFGTHGGGQNVEELPPLFPRIEAAAA